MSKYTDYLNNNPDIDWKDFLRLCAWNASALKKLAPEEIAPIQSTIDISAELEKLNNDTDEALDLYQEMDSLTPEQQKEKRDEHYGEIKEKHYADINRLENLMSIYGNLLADLCRFPAQSAEMKELKVFAIKELSSNMPNLAAYASLPVEPSITSYINNLKKERKAEFDRLSNEYTAKSKDNLAANEYITIMLEELAKAELEGEADATSYSGVRL